MLGITNAIISGIAMSIQGIFNTRLNDKIGIFETTVTVQGIAFLASLIAYFLFKNGKKYSAIKSVNKLYLLGGILGVVITYTVIKSLSILGATVGIGIILISQLLSAAIIDSTGMFDSNKINFTLNNFIGIVLMIIGIIIFQYNRA